MNIAIGKIIDKIQGMIDDHSTETRADILDHCNIAYFELGAEHIFPELTKIITGTISSKILPADFLRFIYAEDGESKTYFKSGRCIKYDDARYYKYFKDITTENTPLVTGSDGVIAANGTAFTSVAPSTPFTAAMVGEYIRIGTNLGIYKISAFVSTTAITLSDGYRGAAETAAHYEVRPIGTPKLGVLDEDAADITSSTLQMWYLAQPLPLYNDYDPILLPGTCEALRIKVCQLMDQTNKYDNDGLKKAGSFEDAKSKMISLAPIPSKFVAPRDKNGNRLMFGRNRSISASYVPDSGRL